MFLLDTDVLSNLILPQPSESLLDRLATLAPSDQFSSTISVGELYYGIFKSARGGEAVRERIELLLKGDLQMLPFDESSARIYGRIRADLEREGLPIGDADTRIAAIALAYDLTVVTGNVKHYDRIPTLAVENWLA